MKDKAKRDILNVGCGNFLKPEWVNVDRTKHRPEVDVVHDLNVLPWPFPDESFDQIVARASLEHLDIDLLTSINECWRILRPGGILYVKVPYWDSAASYDDVTHRWRFSLGAFDQFDPRTKRGQAYGFYTDRKWHIVKGPRLNRSKSSIHVTMRKIVPEPAVDQPAAEPKAKPKAETRKRKPKAKTGDGAQLSEADHEAVAELSAMIEAEAVAARAFGAEAERLVEQCEGDVEELAAAIVAEVEEEA